MFNFKLSEHHEIAFAKWHNPSLICPHKNLKNGLLWNTCLLVPIKAAIFWLLLLWLSFNKAWSCTKIGKRHTQTFKLNDYWTFRKCWRGWITLATTPFPFFFQYPLHLAPLNFPSIPGRNFKFKSKSPIFPFCFQFKRMLNKELSHFSESKSGNQISEYICSTFLGKSVSHNERCWTCPISFCFWHQSWAGNFEPSHGAGGTNQPCESNNNIISILSLNVISWELTYGSEGTCCLLSTHTNQMSFCSLCSLDPIGFRVTFPWWKICQNPMGITHTLKTTIALT